MATLAPERPAPVEYAVVRHSNEKRAHCSDDVMNACGEQSGISHKVDPVTGSTDDPELSELTRAGCPIVDE
jgi:hypothetical protein